MQFRQMVFALVLALSVGPASADMQSDRQAFIQKLIARGAFQKVERPGQYAHVWVRPAFYDLEFDLKQKFVSVVYAYYRAKDARADVVVLFDGRTNKKIGSFSEVGGGLSLD